MTIIAVNTRLARRLGREFDEAQERKGLRYWEPPTILTWAGWLARLWEEVAYSGKDERILLGAGQERVLWEAVIQESAAGDDLLNLDGTAAAAADAWAFLHDWRLPRQRTVFERVPDTEAFFGWMSAFRERLARDGFITAAELPSVVEGRPDYVAGFDKLTAAQREMLRDTPEYPTVQVKVRDVWRVGCADEVRAAAWWAREQLERNGSARIGVVLLDLAARRPAVARVFEEVLGTPDAFHVSAPVPLSEVPLVRAALLSLTGDQEAIARSPFFQHTAELGARLDLDRRHEKKVAGAVLDERLRRPSGWSAEFSRVAMEKGWPGVRGLSSEEYQALESWKDLLAEFARLDLVIGEVGRDAALDRFQHMAEEKGFGAEEQDEPVQVMGVLEVAGARFHALWLGGLHDGAWPPAAGGNPFVPVPMQRTVADQYEFAMRTTQRLLQAAEEVICSWPIRSGEENLRASPLIAALPERSFAVPVSLPVPVAWEQISDDLAPAFEGALQRGGMAVIADQSLCPFRAFARHRLGARSLDTLEEGLSAQERGNVMHDALQMIWSEIKTQRALLEMSAGEVTALLTKCAAAALGKQKLAHRGERVRMLEGIRTVKILQEWMRVESARPPFETGDVEVAHTIAIGELPVEVRLDRVDRYADGSLGLIDYKTGKSGGIGDWDTERPKAPQLPLYSVAMEQPVSSVMFARIAAGSVKFVGLSEVGEAVTKQQVEPRIQEWRRVLENLAAAFVRGEAVVDPLKGACDLCDLQGLCRVSAADGDE